MKEFLKERNRETPIDDSWEKAMAWNIFCVEKECSQKITPNYPLMKFYSLIDNLKKDNENNKNKMRK